MHVDYFVLADATAAAQGKHYIHGAGWDRLFAPSFPVVHPLLAVAIRFSVGWAETNQPHEFELDLHDEDGQSILPVPPGPLRGVVNVGRPPNLEPGDDQVVPVAVALRDVGFTRAGRYAIMLRVDGTDAGRISFRVTPMPAPPAG